VSCGWGTEREVADLSERGKFSLSSAKMEEGRGEDGPPRCPTRKRADALLLASQRKGGESANLSVWDPYWLILPAFLVLLYALGGEGGGNLLL